MRYRVTIFVPEAMVQDANQLALCKGTSQRDVNTFGELWSTDSFGNRYSYAGVSVSEEWLQGVGQPAEAPVFAPDADTVAASRAQADIVQTHLWAATEALPTQITAVIGPDEVNQIPVHMATVGLTVE